MAGSPRPEITVAIVRILAVLIAVVLCAGHPAAAQEGNGDAKKSEKKDTLDKLPGWLGGKEAQFFRLPVFNVPVIRAGEIVGQVSMTVMIETSDFRNKNKIIENRHQIQNGFLRDLHGVVSLDSGAGRSVNIPTVKARLLKVADKILGPGIVTDILVDNVYVRQFN